MIMLQMNGLIYKIYLIFIKGVSLETDKPIIDSKFKAYYMIKFLINLEK